MAKVLRLANKAQSTTADILSGYLAFSEWFTSPGDAVTSESFLLAARGSDANIIGAANNISELASKAVDFHSDPLEEESIWFEAKATDETAKRSLIYDIDLQPVQDGAFAAQLLGKSGAYYTLDIQRHPAWENVAASTYTGAGKSCTGGKWLPTVAEGTMPGRIRRFMLGGVSGAGTIAEMWVGIRPLYENGATNFDPVFDLTDSEEVTAKVDILGTGSYADWDPDTSYELTTSSYIYIPMGAAASHRVYIQMGDTLNNNTMVDHDIEYRAASSWENVSDIDDDTYSAGAPFAQSGEIAWTEQTITSYEVDGVTDYWIRIQPSANLDPIKIAAFVVIHNTLTTMTNGAYETYNADASGLTSIKVPSVASGLTKYVAQTVGQHDSSNADEYHGSYMVLGRCIVDSGTVQLRLDVAPASFASGRSHQCQAVYITNTTWKLVELGNITLPLSGTRASGGDESAQYDELQIYAAQISGTSVLQIDQLILIPSQHYAKVSGSATQYISGADNRPVCFYTFENDENAVTIESGGSSSSITLASLEGKNGLMWPYGGGVVVIAGQRSTLHSLTDTLDLYMEIYPRWHNHRE